MTQTFFIPGPLPGANDIIRKHWRVYDKLKREWGGICAVYIRKAKLTPVASCHLSLVWHEKNERRDFDNICFGVKFLADSLVACGIIKDDKRKYVTGIAHRVIVDYKWQGVVVTLES